MRKQKCILFTFLVFVAFLCLLPKHGYAQRDRYVFDAELTDVKLILNGNKEVPFGSQSISKNDLWPGEGIGIRGKVRVKRGELFYLMLEVRETGGTPLLQKATARRPMTEGVYDWGGQIRIGASGTATVQFRLTGLSQNRMGGGPSFYYPENPIVIKKKGLRISPFKAVFTRRQVQMEGTPPVDFSAIPPQGLVHESSPARTGANLSTEWALESGKVTSVDYSRDGGNSWASLYYEAGKPIARGGVNCGVGETLNLVFRLKGVDTDEEGVAASQEKFIVDTLRAKVIINKKAPVGPITAFKVKFSNQTIMINNQTKRFSEIPGAGLTCYADSPLKIFLKSDWELKGADIFLWISKDGGRNKESLQHPMVYGGEYEFQAAPGQSFDFVWGADGFDTDSARGQVGASKTIKDTLQARVMVMKPGQTVPLDARLTNIKLNEWTPIEKANNVDQRGGYADTADAYIKGEFKSDFAIDRIEISLDGGASWNKINPSAEWTYGFTAKHNQNYDVRFRVVAKDGRIAGPEKYPQARLRFVKRPISVTIEGRMGPGTISQIPSRDLPISGYLEQDGKVHITGGVMTDGSLNRVELSLDGGKAWEKLTGQNWDYSFTPKAANAYELRFRYVDNDGRIVGPDGLPKANFRFGKEIKPEVKLTGLTLINFPKDSNFATIGDTFPIDDWQIDAGIALTGKLEWNVPLDYVIVSLDGGKTWASQEEPREDFVYYIRPIDVNRDYELVFRASDKNHNAIDITGYPKKKFRFVKLRGLVKVPMVTSTPAAEAKGFVESCGLKVTIQERFTDNPAYEGFIIETIPTAGTSVEKGSSVTLVVARTPRVVDVRGNDEAEAKKFLESYGFKVTVKKEDVENADDAGRVIRTNPPAGTKVKAGSTVEIFIGQLKTSGPITFSAIFSDQKLTIGGKTTKFSDIPASGLIYASDDPVKIKVEALWSIKGAAPRFNMSKDGGKTWIPMTHSGYSGDPKLGKGGSWEEIQAAPNESLDFVLRVEGYDADASGKMTGGAKYIVDTVHKIVSIKKKTPTVIKSETKPIVVISNVKVNGVALEDVEKDSPIGELKGGEVFITGDINTNIPVDNIKLSINGGITWEALGTKTPLSYRFKPVTEKDYELIFKAVLKDGKECDTAGYPKNRFRFTGAAATVSEDPAKVLLEMAKAYDGKSFAGFISRVSENFPNKGELEEFVRRDFRDYSSIKIDVFTRRTVDIPNGKSIQADWNMTFFPTSVSGQIRITGSNLEFVFVNEEGKLKLIQMRGQNPLFGARSPDVAAAAGVPTSVVQTLQKIEDEGVMSARQTAMMLIAAQIQTGMADLPVTFEIIEAFANYTNGAMEQVNFDAVQTLRPFKAGGQVRIIDNPKNIDFNGVMLLITDSLTGGSVSVTSTVDANQTVAFRADQDITLPAPFAGRSGTITFILDPDNKFIMIDKSKKTVRVSYTAV